MDKWPKLEKKVAREAFDKAYERCCDEIIGEIREINFDSYDQIWELCDLLNSRRKEVNNLFDYRYSQLLFLFPLMLRKGWLTLEELEGLKEDKIAHLKRASSLQ